MAAIKISQFLKLGIIPVESGKQHSTSCILFSRSQNSLVHKKIVIFIKKNMQPKHIESNILIS